MIQFIKSAINSLNKLIARSVTSDEVSSTRISSYLILAPIQLMICIVVLIEFTSFIHSIYGGHDYVLSNEFIITFGMILSHHLAILFSRSKSQSREELKGGQTDEPISEEETK